MILFPLFTTWFRLEGFIASALLLDPSKRSKAVPRTAIPFNKASSHCAKFDLDEQ